MNTAMFEALKKASPKLAAQYDPATSDESRLVNRAKSGESVTLASIWHLFGELKVHGTHKRYTEVIVDELDLDKLGKKVTLGEIRSVSFYIRDLHQLSKHEIDFDEITKLGVLGSDRIFFPISSLEEVVNDFWDFRSSIYYNESSKDTIHVCLYKI